MPAFRFSVGLSFWKRDHFKGLPYAALYPALGIRSRNYDNNDGRDHDDILCKPPQENAIWNIRSTEKMCVSKFIAEEYVVEGFCSPLSFAYVQAMTVGQCRKR